MTVRRALLIGLNLALLGGLALVLQPKADDQSTPPEGPWASRRVAAPESDPDGPAGALAGKPLFRRADVPPPVAEPPAIEVPTTPGFRLAGIVWGDGDKLAIVQLPDDAGHRRVRRGETLDHWTLSELTPRSATFQGRETSVTLGLSVASSATVE